MPYERTGYAPWSLTREAGVQSATVDGTISVPQYVYPNLDTGFIDEKGNWQGRKSSDETFIGITIGEGIANGGELLAPDTSNFPSIDMTGFNDIIIAIKPSNGGNVAMSGIMGPDTTPFANLTPVNAAATLKGSIGGGENSPSIYNFLSDSAESMTADVWNIFYIGDKFKNQKNLQFKLVNNSGGASTIEFAFMRVV